MEVLCPTIRRDDDFPLRRATRSILVFFVCVLLGMLLVSSTWAVASAATSGPISPTKTDLLVSVAASLKDVADELRPLFEDLHPDVRLQFNFGSSGALAQQIMRGAPVDVFLSAAEWPIVGLRDRGLVDPETVKHVAANRLVLIVPQRQGRSVEGSAEESRSAVTDWTILGANSVKTIAIGNPNHVPAGIYARQTLTSLGLWDLVQSKLVLGEDVRQVLQYVRLGAGDAGVVYATDVAAMAEGTTGIRVVAEAPVGSHLPIVYTVARIRSSAQPASQPAAADALIEFLFTPEAWAVFARHGFSDVE